MEVRKRPLAHMAHSRYLRPDHAGPTSVAPSVVVEMPEIKDQGRELHISKPRFVGLAAAVLVSPIYFVFASYGHSDLGTLAWFVTCGLFAIAYVNRSRIRRLLRKTSRPSSN